MIAYSIRELAGLLHAPQSDMRACCLLRAYLDESGTHSDSPAVTISGMVASEDAWAMVEVPWRKVLDELEPYGVKYWHTAEALSQEGQFGRLEAPLVKYALVQFAEIVSAVKGIPISSSVDVNAWDVVPKDAAFLKRFPSPLALCFEDIVRSLALWARRYAPGELVAPVFAYRNDYANHESMGADLLRLYGSQGWYRRHLAAIAFDYPDRLIPLQAADFVAHQMNKDVHARIEQRVPPLSVAFDKMTNGSHVFGHWFDCDGLALTVKRFAESGEIYPLG